jgi:hypothetical protein
VTVAGPVRLAVWSGPRNISTALMRAWENRGDTVVLDEPLYAHYLAHTGLDHPGRDEVIADGEPDWRRAVDRCRAPVPAGFGVSYQKHMAHHLLDHIARDWLVELTHALLIRHPVRVLASYSRVRSAVTVEDLGLPQQVALLHELRARTGRAPLVLDAADVLTDPEGYLRALCEAAGVTFTDRMLSWPAGPRESDGVWAPHWYGAVWRSTGFTPPDTTDVDVPPGLDAVARRAAALYDELHDARLVL